MNLLKFLKLPWNKNQFVTDEHYKHNLIGQVHDLPIIIDRLRQIGISDDKELHIEYFFYTNSSEKAEQLAIEMEQLQYSAMCRESASDKKLLVITGMTTKMRMTEEVLINWVGSMCELGRKHDCDFDGWGTSPDFE